MEKPLNDILVEMKSSFDSFIGAAEQLIAEQKTEPEFKKGDFIKTGDFVAIVDYIDFDDVIYFICFYNLDGKYLEMNSGCGIGKAKNAQMADELEIQPLLNALHEQNFDWDFKECEIIPYMGEAKEYVFKIRYNQRVGRFDILKWTFPLKGHCQADEFKTKALAQAACDTLNETIETLKHY